MLKLTCYGGAEIVTGSNFLIEGARGKILVDCGLEQGNDFVEKEMYAPFPYDVPSIDAVVITHAHLDHIGRVPKLIKEGFRGKIYMTPATKDLMQLMLEDTVDILTQEAHQHGLEPLYTDDDIKKTMPLVETIEYHEEREVAPGLSIYLRNTGHILGSASIRIKEVGKTSENGAAHAGDAGAEAETEGVSLALTGDIGNIPSPYLPDWEPITDADYVLMESVYGDRVNTDKDDRVALLRDTLKKAIARNGVILIPAFSIERTQLMLYEIGKLMDAGELPQIRVFLDSPLAIKATEIYEKWLKEQKVGEGSRSAFFKPAAEEEFRQRHDLFKFPFLTETLSREDSQEIDKAPNPKIIMAGAGMSHGGRIGHWEQKYLPDPSTTLIIVGYQAPGSPGRLLQDGAPHVRLGGVDVRIKGKIETFVGWSAHADRDGLLDFARAALPGSGEADAKGNDKKGASSTANGGISKGFFIALGEPSSARFLAQRIHDYLGSNAIVPVQGESFEISKKGIKRVKQ